MLSTLAQASQALAAWHYLESSSARDDASPPELKARTAEAYAMFLRSAYGVAFELVPYLVKHSEEITTANEVRYSAVTGGGGFIVQKMNLVANNPGIPLYADTASAENFLQLLIDLPELLTILGIS